MLVGGALRDGTGLPCSAAHRSRPPSRQSTLLETFIVLGSSSDLKLPSPGRGGVSLSQRPIVKLLCIVIPVDMSRINLSVAEIQPLADSGSLETWEIDADCLFRVIIQMLNRELDSSSVPDCCGIAKNLRLLREAVEENCYDDFVRCHTEDRLLPVTTTAEVRNKSRLRLPADTGDEFRRCHREGWGFSRTQDQSNYRQNAHFTSNVEVSAAAPHDRIGRCQLQKPVRRSSAHNRESWKRRRSCLRKPSAHSLRGQASHMLR